MLSLATDSGMKYLGGRFKESYAGIQYFDNISPVVLDIVLDEHYCFLITSYFFYITGFHNQLLLVPS